MSHNHRRTFGLLLVGIGVATPIIALVVYSALCPMEPCGLGGPGTCMFGHASCHGILNPGYVWLFSSVVALVLIFTGRPMVREAEVAMGKRCARCDDPLSRCTCPLVEDGETGTTGE